MFVLTRLRCTVRLAPSSWDTALGEALENALNAKLANKVVYEVGLVLSVFDLLHIGESFLLPMDEEGASHTPVEFRALVFRPFVEEILVGKIKTCTPAGVSVSLGFFDDVLIPPEALPYPCRFEENEQTWVWEYQAEEDGEKVDMFMDANEEIRFRVTSEKFVDTSPNAPEMSKTPSGQSISGSEEKLKISEAEDKRIPYAIKATVNEAGLGLISWWDGR